MAFRVEKPAFNLRSRLKELDFETLPYQKVNPGGIIQQKYYYSDSSGGNESETSSESWQDTIFYTCYFTPREVDSMVIINWQGRSRVRKFGNTGHKMRTARYDSDENQSIHLMDGDSVWWFSANSSESSSNFPLGYWYTYFNFDTFDDNHTTRQYKYVMQHMRTGGDGTVRIGENSAHGHLHAIITEVKQ
jgi:hypothetical protein